LIGKGHANTVKRFLNVLDSNLEIFVKDWESPPPNGRDCLESLFSAICRSCFFKVSS
jgi:hypothetical protein